MSEDPRRYHRKQAVSSPACSTELEVELGAEKRWSPAKVLDVAIGGMGLLLPPDSPIRAEMTLRVRIWYPELAEPLVEYARVRHASPAEDGLRIGVEFLDWMGLLERIPMGLAELFNRRRSERIATGTDHTVRIYFEAAGVATVVEGCLQNLSTNGCAFVVDPVNGARLLRSDLVLVSFRLPGSGRYLSFRAQLRHIFSDQKAWRFGAFFDDEGFQFEERKAEIAHLIGAKASFEFPQA